MKTLFTQAFPPTLKDYYDSKIAALTFDASNTASGTNIVEINAISGVAVFTEIVIADMAPTLFTITNSIITIESKMNFSLEYESVGDETCQVSSYIANNGSVTIYMNNFSGANAEGNKTISFKILNP